MKPATARIAAAIAAILAMLTASLTATSAQAGNGWAAPQGVSIELSAGFVSTIAQGPGNTAYVAGNFMTDDLGNPRFFTIGAWNGKKLTPLPSTPQGVTHSLVYDPRSDALYAGGLYYQGSTLIGVLKLTGTSWTPVVEFDRGTVYAMAVASDGTLYIGGEFGKVNGEPYYNNVAAYSQATGWSSIGAVFDGSVSSMVVDSRDRLFVGGVFTRYGSYSGSQGSVLMWDGTGWSWVGSTNGAMTSLAMARGDVLYARGNFTSVEGEPMLIAKIPLRGTNRWEAVTPPPVEPTIYGTSLLSASPQGDLLVGIDDRIYVLGSTGWTTVPGAFEGGVRIIHASSGGALLAGGPFVAVDGTRMPGLAYRSDKQPPPAPTGVGASRWSNRTIMVTWDLVRTTPRVTRYRVKCESGRRVGRAVSRLPLVEVTVPVKGTYQCRVQAINSAGESPWSAPVRINLPR